MLCLLGQRDGSQDGGPVASKPRRCAICPSREEVRRLCRTQPAETRGMPRGEEKQVQKGTSPLSELRSPQMSSLMLDPHQRTRGASVCGQARSCRSFCPPTLEGLRASTGRTTQVKLAGEHFMPSRPPQRAQSDHWAALFVESQGSEVPEQAPESALLCHSGQKRKYA